MTSRDQNFACFIKTIRNHTNYKGPSTRAERQVHDN